MKSKHSFLHTALVLFLVIATTLKSYSQDVGQHLWKQRVLLIKITTEDSAQLDTQLSEFKQEQKALARRKFVLYTLRDKNYIKIDYTQKTDRSSGKISSAFKNDFLDPKAPFEVILIGLDGGVKHKQNELLAKQELYNLVDRMPMRRSELKNKG